MPGAKPSPVGRAAAAVLAGLLGVAFPVAAGPLPAEPGDPPAPKWTDGIALRAFVSASFSHNFKRPASATNQLRAFDTDDGSIRLDVASLVLERPRRSRARRGSGSTPSRAPWRGPRRRAASSGIPRRVKRRTSTSCRRTSAGSRPSGAA